MVTPKPDPPPLAPVGPGGPQPGYNENWAFQQSRFATEVAASLPNPQPPAPPPVSPEEAQPAPTFWIFK